MNSFMKGTEKRARPEYYADAVKLSDKLFREETHVIQMNDPGDFLQDKAKWKVIGTKRHLVQFQRLRNGR